MSQASTVVLAARVGRLNASMAALAQCPDRELRADLYTVRSQLEQLLLGTRKAYVQYVRDEVWPSEHRTAFYVHAPLQSFLLGLVDSRDELDIEELLLVCDALLAGADEARVAAAMVPLIQAKVLTVDDETFSAACLLLKRVAISPSLLARTSLLDPGLFEALGIRMVRGNNEPFCVATAARLLLDASLFDNLCVVPVVHRCARCLAHSRVEWGSRPHLRACLDVLERACAEHSVWRDRLMVHVVGLGTSGWDEACAPLLATMLGTTSVELVLRLHTAGRLASLAGTADDLAHREGAVGLSWRAVRASLRRQWPSYISPPWPTPSSGVVCPITLDHCAIPVVASDGYTYERDAIVRHMATNGPVSPMTRQTLEYHLYDNRAAQ